MEDPGTGCVWNYFKYLEEDKSVCLVTLGDGEHGQCGHSIKEKFLTNLNCHLKSKHHEQFKELQKKGSNKEEENGSRATRKSDSATFTGTQSCTRKKTQSCTWKKKVQC